MDGAAPIAVIGGANIDISAKHSAPVAVAGDSQRGKISVSAGGVARNIAENLARLGSAVQLITGLGDDWFSALVRDSLDLPLLDISACFNPPIPLQTAISACMIQTENWSAQSTRCSLSTK